MGTNVFNSSAMAAVAAAAMGTGGSRHHHSAVGGQSTMLFTPTPVAGTPLGMASSPTAFPFPPPSPLFLPALNLLQQSPQVSVHSHLQPLSPWLSSPITSLSTLGMSVSGKFSESNEFTSDDNNNDLSTSNAQNPSPSTPPKSKFRSVEHDFTGNELHPNRGFSFNPSSKELKPYTNGLFEFEKDKTSIDSPTTKSYSPPKTQANQNRLENHSWAVSEATESYPIHRSSPQMKSSVSKLPDSSKVTESPQLAFKPSFLMSTYVGSNPTVPSPTYPIGIRPPPPSPQTPTQHGPFGSHYPHYLLPPSLYSYYHNQQAPTQSYSPTSQSQSPISPFLVPNLPQSTSPSMISSVASNACHLPSPNIPNSASSMFEAFSQQNNSNQSGKINDHANSEVGKDTSKEGYSSQKSQSLRSHSQVIDLTPDRQSTDSPVDCTKLHAYSTNKSDNKPVNEFGNSLKRKSPIEENVELFKSAFRPSSVEQSSSTNSASRKHRILKPPNIDISECDYRNGFSSAFLHSPLFGQQFANQMPSSPYTYLEHIPLSAPPIAPSHNSSKFDFSGHSDAFALASPQRLSASSNKDISVSHSLLNQFGSNQLASMSVLSKSTNAKCDMPSSIMKDSKKKSSSNGTTSESKVTFQVPHVNKNLVENQENRYKERNLPSPQSLKSKMSSVNNRKQSQKYPEYFRKGSTIKLGNGDLKKVEELSTEDFIESASSNGKLKVELSEVLFIGDKSKKGLVRISFLVGQSKVKVSLDSPVEHPFFVVQKGWSSCSPSTCSKRYGLNCHRLTKGDIVVTLASKQTNGSVAKSFSSQQLPRSLASSSGSLSSSSSMSSSSSSLTMNSSCNSNLYSSSHISLPKCPPPAHLSKPSHKSLLHSNNETALNLDTKSNRKISGQNSENHSSIHREDEDEEIDVENVDDDDRTRALS